MNKNHHHRIEKTLRLLTFICLTITTFISGCTDKGPSVPERTVFVEPFFSKHQQETLLLHRPGALRVGRDDYLYLLDAGYQHILKFSSDDAPVDTIGKRGQGPGELSQVRNFVLDPENNLYVLDDGLHRVSIFRCNGEFFNAFTYDGASASSIAVSDDGDISLYQSAADHSMITRNSVED